MSVTKEIVYSRSNDVSNSLHKNRNMSLIFIKDKSLAISEKI